MQMFSKKMMVLEAPISWHKATMLNTWCFMKSEVCVLVNAATAPRLPILKSQSPLHPYDDIGAPSCAKIPWKSSWKAGKTKKPPDSVCKKPHNESEKTIIWSFINQNQLTHAHITAEPVIETRIDMRPNIFANHAGTHSMTLRCTHCIDLAIKGCNYLVTNLELILVVHEQYCDLTLVVDNHPQTQILILSP